MLNGLNLKGQHLTIGALPASYLASLSYEEQLLLLSKKQDEVIEFINTILEQKISEYINQKFNDIMIDSMYDAQTETLILYLTERSSN